MVLHYTPGQAGFVADDDFVIMLLFDRFKQVQLQGAFALQLRRRAYEQEAPPPFPTIGFPFLLDVVHPVFATGDTPAGFFLFSILAFKSANRSNGTEMVYSTPRLSSNSTMASLKNALSMRTSITGTGKGFAHGLYAPGQKVARPVGVVHVAAAVMVVENLPGLGDGAE